MKKILAVILSLVIVFSLAGCGSGSSDSENADETAAAAENAAESTDDSLSGAGYVFVYNGVNVIIDAEADEIIEALGEYKSYYEAASCAFDGLDKIYTYDSFEIDTYPTDDVDYISAVILKDDLVETAEGICIGSSLSEVEAAYGEGSDDSGYLTYEKDDMKLCFILEDDVVVSIEYQTKVLD